MKTTLLFLAIFVAFASGQGSEEIPPELRCFLRGFFKCRSGLQSICSEFKGNNRRPVPIPKRRFNGQCPILGTQIPKTDLKDIDLPPCPCTNGNEGDSVDVCFTCIDRSTGVVLKKPQEGKISINCKPDGRGVDTAASKCEFF